MLSKPTYARPTVDKPTFMARPPLPADLIPERRQVGLHVHILVVDHALQALHHFLQRGHAGPGLQMRGEGG